MSEIDPPVIPLDRGEDLHHLEIVDSADLVLFMAGNQFMAMEAILAAFRTACPSVEKIFYETLPPGIELRQILARGAFFGKRRLSVRPDVYTSVSLKGMQALEAAGRIDPGAYRLYLHNRLTLMVPEGNPGDIRSVSDLAGENIRISQPDPENEDIAHHIVEMYRRAGGEKLVHRIMEEKRLAGTTRYTVVHHRETPRRIAEREVEVGPVWATEAIHARSTGLPFEVVDPGESLDQRDRINYYICRLKDAPHPGAARRFVEFILSDAARDIYAHYGFVPPVTHP